MDRFKELSGEAPLDTPPVYAKATSATRHPLGSYSGT
jgi:hypothetical protein